MRIIDLSVVDRPILEQAATLLVDAFREHWPNAWPNIESARSEVQEALQEGKIAQAALDDSGNLLGWVGAVSKYEGNAWELHPLVVNPKAQGMGIGSALLSDTDHQVRERGGITIYLGSDDEDQMTSLSNVDLYQNITEKISSIRNLKKHPFEFYVKQGYTITVVIPDANGPGKPDIIMAKRIGL